MILIQKFWRKPQEDCFSGDSGLQPSSGVTCPDDLHKIPAVQTRDPTSINSKTDLIALWVETFPSFVKPANVCTDAGEWRGNEYVAEKHLIQRTRKVKDEKETVKVKGDGYIYIRRTCARNGDFQAQPQT